MLLPDGVPPRRCRIDLMVPAEKVIREALLIVEAMGVDERLSKAVMLLSEASMWVSEYVDAQVP